MQTIFISSFVSAIVSTMIWIIKDKILYKREKNKEKIILLKSLYEDMGIISQGVTSFGNEEMDYQMSKSIGNLGFHLRVFFPTLFNDDYHNCITQILTLKFEANMKKLNQQFDDEYLKLFSTKVIEVNKLVSIVCASLVQEAEKYK